MFVNFQRRDTVGARHAKINPRRTCRVAFHLQAGVNVSMAEPRFRPFGEINRPADISINSERATRRDSVRPTLIGPPPIAFISSAVFRHASRPLGPGCVFHARAPSDRDYIDFRNEREAILSSPHGSDISRQPDPIFLKSPR